ncbi:MAG: AI-2E family transporter [Xanthobacteraceae bacterium]
MNTIETSVPRRRFSFQPIQLNTDAENPPNIQQANFWRTGAFVAVIGIFILLLIAFLYLAKSLLVPIVAAVVVSATFGPLSRRAEDYRIPAPLFALFAVLIVLVAINLIFLLLGGTISSWAGRSPQIAAALKEKAQILERPLSALREFQAGIASMLGIDPGEPLKLDMSPSSFITPVLAVLSPALGELVLFVGSLFFLLLGRNRQRKFVVMLFTSQEGRLRALRVLNDIEHNFTRYLLSVSAINFIVGVAATGIAYFCGLETPLILGTAAFLLNFVPYIGPAITSFMLFVVGVMTLPTLAGAFVAPACFALFATLEGQFITPSILGRQLTVSPLAIFLSLAFWTWLWGPIGTFLAMPFLIAAIMIREHVFPPSVMKLPE